MFIAFLIMLREGFEATLIIGILASYLVHTGRQKALPSLWIGAGVAVLLSAAAGVAIQWAGMEFPQREQEFFEGLVGLVAVGMLVSMVFWMRRAGRSIKKELEAKVESSLKTQISGWNWSLAVVAFLVTGREGLEAAVFLIAVVQQSPGPAVPLGAALGLVCAAVLGWAVFKGGMKIDLRRFFRWTGAFVILVAGGLVASSLNAFHEAGLWNYLQATAFDLSTVLPSDSLIGTLLGGLLGYRDAPSVGEVLAYLAFTIPALVLFFMPTSAPARPKTT
ncbi:MAG: iron uptake transporter permease EfeU [Aestuariivirga sp.]